MHSDGGWRIVTLEQCVTCWEVEAAMSLMIIAENTWGFQVLLQLTNALPVAPLFGLHHFDIAKICRLDWLHAADQGVTADYIGQQYKFLLPRLGGGTPSLELDVLWKDIQSGYERHPTESKLDTLTAAMLSPSARFPEIEVLRS